MNSFNAAAVITAMHQEKDRAARHSRNRAAEYEHQARVLARSDPEEAQSATEEAEIHRDNAEGFERETEALARALDALSRDPLPDAPAAPRTFERQPDPRPAESFKG